MADFPWLVLILPMVACQLDFTNLIYDMYGFEDGVTQQLSSKNLTELINKVLDGRYYNKDHLKAGDKDASSETVSYDCIRDHHTFYMQSQL